MPISKKLENAVVNNRSLFQKVIKNVTPSSKVLKPARQNKKLGNGHDIIRKGKLKGAALYSLTLEERATCPRDCHHYTDCYMNNVPFATRYNPGIDLENKIVQEVNDLTSLYSKLMVRLHVGGDFYSPEYVKLWANLVDKHPNLYLFGYTAWTSGPIYEAIKEHLLNKSSKVSIRFSVDTTRYNDVVKDLLPKPTFAVSQLFNGPAIVCPEMQSKTDSCLSCALCWTIDKNIKFLNH